MILDSLAKFGVSNMVKTAKMEACVHARARALIVKGGVEKAASALGFSRFTIYNYGDQVRFDVSASRWFVCVRTPSTTRATHRSRSPRQFQVELPVNLKFLV